MPPSATSTDANQDFHYEHWTPRFNPWVITFTVTLATFMEALDSSIANAGKTLAYVDTVHVLVLLTACLIPIGYLMKKPRFRKPVEPLE